MSTPHPPAPGLPSSGSWWHFYFRPVLSPRSDWSRLPSSIPAGAPLVCFFMLFATIAVVLYWLLSSETYMAAIIAKARSSSGSDFNYAEEAMERAMANPALKLFVVLDAVLKRARSVFSFLVAVIITMKILSRKGTWREYIISTSLSTSVLLFGIVIQSLVMYVLMDEGFTPSVMMLIDPGSLLPPVAEFLRRLDVFCVWFLGSLAARLTHVSSEAFPVVFALVFADWLIVFSAMTLLDASFLFLL